MCPRISPMPFLSRQSHIVRLVGTLLSNWIIKQTCPFGEARSWVANLTNQLSVRYKTEVPPISKRSADVLRKNSSVKTPWSAQTILNVALTDTWDTTFDQLPFGENSFKNILTKEIGNNHLEALLWTLIPVPYYIHPWFSSARDNVRLTCRDSSNRSSGFCWISLSQKYSTHYRQFLQQS